MESLCKLMADLGLVGWNDIISNLRKVIMSYHSLHLKVALVDLVGRINVIGL